MIIKSPGVYDISDKEYHADPCPEPSLSSSIMKVLIDKTPQHAFIGHPRLNKDFQQTNNSKFDIGKLGHKMLLGTGEPVVRIDADSFRSDEAKYYRKKAWKEGKIPVLLKDYQEAERMVESAKQQLSVNDDGKFFLDDGYSEQTTAWIENGIWQRAKLDRITLSRHIIYDYKTTDALTSIDAYINHMLKLKYDISIAHYIEGEIQLHKSEPSFFLIVQETKPPFALVVIGLSGHFLQIGRIKRQRALTMWTWCMKHNKWPGYPTRAIYVDPPGYEAAKYLDENGNDLSSVKENMKEKLKMWEGWQAPIVEKKDG